MNTTLQTLALWLAVVWPLLLAIPALHSRLPWPRHLALAPALLLLLLPGDATLALPWLLLGSGFAIDGEIRWLLAMAVTIWLMAATLTQPSARGTTLFMLTLAGNLGAILATTLTGFFSFTTLMGYGFYGLLIQGGDAASRRAGQRYLLVLIAADLLLFEALLLAAATSGDLRYEAVRQTMAEGPFAQLYLWMALAGFLLKIGLWPAHRWLLAAFRSAPTATALLLGGVPVAMGLLGAVRWLPMGEDALYLPGMALLTLGGAILGVALQRHRESDPPRAAAWRRLELLRQWAASRGQAGVSWLAALKRHKPPLPWPKLPGFVAGWGINITLFVLLGLVLAWLAG